MRSLLEFREYLKHFYSKYDVYLKPAAKFLLAFITLQLINGKMGYQEKLNSPSIVLIFALMCSFMPTGFIIFCAALFILVHLYALSLECMLVTLVLFLVMVLLYLRFSPKDTLVVLLTPLFFMLKIPYVMPVAMGLIGTPASAVSVGCGVTVYYLLNYILTNANVLNSMDDDMAGKLRYVVDGFVGNRAMAVTIIAFAVTVILVYMIRRLSVDHSWTIAMIAGTLVNLVILLIGDLMFNTEVSIAGLLFGSIIAVAAAKVLEFFVFNVDYHRTENVQFEDDEYYYYVKAVPKITVSTPEKTVKKINSKQGI